MKKRENEETRHPITLHHRIIRKEGYGHFDVDKRETREGMR